MDKIEKILFRYESEKTQCEEFKKMFKILFIQIAIVVLIVLCLVIFLPEGILIWSTLYMVFMLMLEKKWDGKWGTKKWKKKWVKMCQENFKLHQKILVDVIKDEGLNCQQVYNLLIKKHGRIIPWSDKMTFIIAIISLVMSLISILMQPLLQTLSQDLVFFITCIFVMFLIIGTAAYLLYMIISIPNRQGEKKRNKYEYFMKLLEDHLY